MRIMLQDAVDLARGAAFLGAAGGGDPYIGRLMLEQAIATHGPIEFLAIDDVADDGLVVPAAMFGAPSVMIEKLPNGAEAEHALRAVEKAVGKPACAILPAEIGGINALLPIVLAANTGLPVIDADGMGRAFPELQMVTFNVFGNPASPAALADETGNCVLIEASDNLAAERFARNTTVTMGAVAQICCYPMLGANAKRCVVRGTLTLALGIGRAIRQAREAHLNPVDALLAHLRTTDYYQHCKVLFDGKVSDLRRETSRGFTIGSVTISDSTERERLVVQFQNENLAARRNGRTVAIVPDLITILDRETAEPVTTEALKYGQRVKVVGASVPPVMRLPQSLAVFGPRSFGFDEDFQPIESLS